MRILAVSGSLQARSSNRALLRTARRVAPAGVELVDSISVGEIPPFNPDVEREGPAPAVIVSWREQVAAADGGVLFALAASMGGGLGRALRPAGGGAVRVAPAGRRRSGAGGAGADPTSPGCEVVVSATVAVVAADKGAEELRDPAAVEAVLAALDALTDRSG